MAIFLLLLHNNSDKTSVNSMRYLPKNPAWWTKAVSKANGFGSISPQVNETDPRVAQADIERALARTEAEQARMKIRVLLNKRVKV